MKSVQPNESPTLTPQPTSATPRCTLHLRLERQEDIWIDRTPVLGSAQAAERLERLIGTAGSASGGALYLNERAEPLGQLVTALAPCDAEAEELRRLFSTALLCGASAVLLGHRPAAGGLAPSRAELTAVSALVLSARGLGLEILDYLLLAGESRHRSLQDEFPELWTGEPADFRGGRTRREI